VQRRSSPPAGPAALPGRSLDQPRRTPNPDQTRPVGRSSRKASPHDSLKRCCQGRGRSSALKAAGNWRPRVEHDKLGRPQGGVGRQSSRGAAFRTRHVALDDPERRNSVHFRPRYIVTTANRINHVRIAHPIGSPDVYNPVLVLLGLVTAHSAWRRFTSPLGPQYARTVEQPDIAPKRRLWTG
jgi:hypothetical protein